MKTKTQTSLSTTVQFEDSNVPQNELTVRAHTSVTVGNVGSFKYLNPEEARYLADLLSEAAGIVEQNLGEE